MKKNNMTYITEKLDEFRDKFMFSEIKETNFLDTKLGDDVEQHLQSSLLDILKESEMRVDGKKKDDFGGDTRNPKGTCRWCGTKEYGYHINPCKTLTKEIHNQAIDEALSVLRELTK